MSDVVLFSPLQSFVSPTFWHKLSEVKLELDGLSDEPKSIYGFYTNRAAKSCLLEVDYTSFNSEFKPPKFCHAAVGVLHNKNTIEEYKGCDKNVLLQQAGRKLVDDFKSGSILSNPSSLARFLVLSFADLKSYTYFYWFAFPCPLNNTALKLQGQATSLENRSDLQHFNAILQDMPAELQNFFVLKESDKTKFFTLQEIAKEKCSDLIANDLYFCFADASEYEHPSWLMRLFASFVFFQCPDLIGKTVNFLGLRYTAQMHPGKSLIWQVVQAEPLDLSEESSTTLKFVGWEPNLNNKMGPRMVSLRESMDPSKLAENSIDLNLKLMKWRLVPTLNLNIVAKTKCLLFGAGTLGCSVSRNLLGWGFKHITFLDNGRVSFTNPVRQSLYNYADAISGKSMKATVAAARLKDINPATISEGHVMQIPMPGHTIGENQKIDTEADLNKIRRLVEEHDVIFMLTDSRESRWLPTLLGAALNKIVINAALGFDSYLVMRHGTSKSTDIVGDSPDVGDLKCISGAQLGCYFCNDVTAPGNSLKERTLDQQCTVTRPGVSNIAASYAVELLVSLLQHPMRELAPAYFAATGKSTTNMPEGLLGILPHSIRGMLCNYENILPATQKFPQCIACSEKVIAEYREHGNAFLLKAFETAKYLEDLTGISSYEELDSAIINFEDSDLEMSDD